MDMTVHGTENLAVQAQSIVRFVGFADDEVDDEVDDVEGVDDE